MLAELVGRQGKCKHGSLRWIEREGTYLKSVVQDYIRMGDTEKWLCDFTHRDDLALRLRGCSIGYVACRPAHMRQRGII